jgi:hypothetical protein
VNRHVGGKKPAGKPTNGLIENPTSGLPGKLTSRPAGRVTEALEETSVGRGTGGSVSEASGGGIGAAGKLEEMPVGRIRATIIRKKRRR